MLRFILGISGTGKTGSVLAHIKARAAAGQKNILIVPEQFSSSAEAMVLRALGDRLGAWVEVYSFTSFAELVLKTFGGVAVRTLADAARAVAVRRALDRLGDEVPGCRRHRRSTSFCELCAAAIQELKTAGAGPEDLLAVAQLSTDGQKLRELGLIFAAYEDVIRGSAMDPADRLVSAAERMDEAFLADTAVFLDNFDGFTAPQYKMLEKLVAAQECTLALCCDGLSDYDAGLGLFSPVKAAAARVRRIAAREGVAVAVPTVLSEDLRHRGAPVLGAVNQLLSQNADAVQPARGEGFFLTPAPGIYAECKTVACRIAELVRAGGVNYGDIAIVCRTLDEYAAPLGYELGLAGIPYFADETATLEHSALAGFFAAALTLASRGLATEPLLRLLKTDLCGLDAADTAVLENYAYTWQLRGADWREPFTKNPSGFGAQMTQDDAALLARAEELRARVVPKVEAFLSAARASSAAGISKGLYLLLQAFGGEQNALAMGEAFSRAGDEARAAGVYRTWNEMMGLLGQMEQLLGEDEVSCAEYAELFSLLVRSADLGRVPETQDAVLFTAADRMRLAGPAVCFVLGASEGHFPKLLGASGLLTHADRDLLVQHGVQMPGSYENRTLLEQMFFYRALTAPSRALYVSYVTPEGGGAPMSGALAPLAAALEPPADELSTAQLAPTPAAALDLYGAQYREDTPQTAALARALEQCPEMAAPLAAMDAAAASTPFHAYDRETLAALLGGELRVSPTRVEQYYRCRFSYFLQYVLGLKARKKAQLDPLASGSLVHYILENALRRAGERFGAMSAQELEALAGQIADEYVAQNMPDTSQRFSYLIARLKQGAVRLLQYLQAEQAQSEFRPAAFEQEIGDAPGAVKPLCVRTPEGRSVRVVGKIDRVDVMRREGKSYLRVVDYKTGSKAFSLDDVYCGLNTQMLLYLFTLCRNAGGRFANPTASGVLYLLSDPAPGTVPRAESAQAPLYKVDGLVLDDPVVLHGMDRDATGTFVPVSFSKNGAPRASAKLASPEKLAGIERHVGRMVSGMASGLYGGEIAAAPLVSGGHCPCDVCDYRPVCRHEDGRGETPVSAPKDAFLPEGKESAT